MNKTKIEWVKNSDGSPGYTWNPITGCLNGCEYCYARKLANGRLRSRYLANGHYWIPKEHESLWMDMVIKGKPIPPDTDPFYPRFWPDKVVQMVNYVGLGKRKGIFVCDMSDLFGIGIPEEWTDQVMQAIRFNPRHRFYLLTKQPQNLIKWSPFPDNCWVGVTATNSDMAYYAVEWLREIEAKVKYISFEPLLASIAELSSNMPKLIASKADWIIIGSQTKPYKPPKIEWAEEIVEACDKVRIPVFLKDNLKPLYKTVMPHDDEIFLRQELPR